MFLRPTLSDTDDHRIRPIMLASDNRATNPAAADAATGVCVWRKNSVIIGEAFSRMPMPAVTLKHSTIHSNQNCGVRIAFFAETWLVVISTPFLLAAEVQPAGCQPGGGTRTSITPSDMNTA